MGTAPRYRLERPLGRGGTGTVWRGVDTTSATAVAIKVLRADGDGPAGRRLRREYEIGRTVCHPNLVRTLDLGTLPDGRLFLVQELLVGERLDRVLGSQGPLGPEQALGLLLPLCGALSTLHDRGILHRDIKPANVMLVRRNEGGVVPKLIDLGAARASDQDRLTDPGRVLGTKGAMAPEHVRGHALHSASDVWSLAVVLYACLLGRAPFRHGYRPELGLPALSVAELSERACCLLPALQAALLEDADARTQDARAFARALCVCARAHGLSLPDQPDPIGLPEWPAWLASEGAAPSVTRSLALSAVGSEGADAASAVPCPLGTRVAGRYRLLSLLGEGATGSVFAASDALQQGALVALKRLRHPGSHGLYDLKREFRALLELRHPHLVTPYELAHDAAHGWFFTMDHVMGIHWLDHVRSGQDRGCDLKRLHRTLCQMVSGLLHLHASAFVHRDLKPSNVLVTYDGQVKIVDLGICSAPVPVAETLGAGFRGTPAYAAPEQANGGQIGAFCDWYALGVMMYEALTGELPFTGSAHEVLAAKRQLDPRALTRQAAAHRARLSPPAAPYLDLALALLHPEPQRRPSGEALQRWLEQAAMAAEEPTAEADEPPLEIPFVGRSAELLHLEQAYQASGRGRAVVALIEGPSGMGKTRLLTHFLERVQAGGALVLRGRCRLQETVPYRALDGIIDALFHYLTGLTRAAREGLLPDDLDALCQVFPVLAPLLPAAAHRLGLPHDRGPAAARALRRRAFTAFSALLRAVAAQMPLVLAMDDLQWGDRDSATLLRSVLSESSHGSFPCLIVGVLRSAGDQQGPFVERLLRQPDCVVEIQRLRLPAMDERDVRALSLKLLGPARLSALEPGLMRLCIGHPMFVVELCLSLRQDAGGPLLPSLQHVLASRLARLSTQAYDVVALLCLSGHRLPRQLVLDCLPQSGTAVLHELVHGRALCETTCGARRYLEPYHDQLRAVVVDQVPAERRAALLWHLAQACSREPGADLAIAVDAFLGAGRLREAAVLAEQAAAAAFTSLAFDRAAELLSIAHAHPSDEAERRRLSISLADAYVQAGRSKRAAECYLEASSLSGPNERQLLRCKAMAQYLSSGYHRDGMTLLQSLSGELGFRVNRKGLHGLRPWLLAARLLAGGGPRLRTQPRAGADEPSADWARLQVLWSAALALTETAPVLAAHYTAAALKQAARLGAPLIHAQASALLVWVFPAITGRPLSRLERYTTGLEAQVQRQGDAWDVGLLRAVKGLEALYCGDLVGALQQALPVASDPRAPTEGGLRAQAMARSTCAATLYWMGRIGALEARVTRWLAEAHDTGNLHQSVSLAVVGVGRHLRVDDPDAAERELKRASAVELGYEHDALTSPQYCMAHLLYSQRSTEALAWCEGALCAGRLRWGQRLAGVLSSWALSYGAAIVQLARQGELGRESARRQLIAWQRRIRYLRMDFARAVSAQLRGYVALLDGATERAAVEFQRAIVRYDGAHMGLHGASLRLHLAFLQPENAARLNQDASRVFEREGIRVKERWMETVSPRLIECRDQDGWLGISSRG